MFVLDNKRYVIKYDHNIDKKFNNLFYDLKMCRREPSKELTDDRVTVSEGQMSCSGQRGTPLYHPRPVRRVRYTGVPLRRVRTGPTPDSGAETLPSSAHLHAPRLPGHGDSPPTRRGSPPTSLVHRGNQERHSTPGANVSSQSHPPETTQTYETRTASGVGSLSLK